MADLGLSFTRIKEGKYADALLLIQAKALAGTPLETLVGGLLLERDGHWIGLVTLTGVQDPEVLAELARRTPEVTLLDLKQASEDLVAHQRERILWCLAASAVLLVIVVFVALRDWSRVRRVLAPMALTTLVVLGMLHAAGVSLKLDRIPLPAA